MTPVKVGDRVAYTREFCRNTGQRTGDVPFARGVVQAMDGDPSFSIASVRWEGAGVYGEYLARINAKNLIRADELHLEPA
jgi:hypothetical protein